MGAKAYHAGPPAFGARPRAGGVTARRTHLAMLFPSYLYGLYRNVKPRCERLVHDESRRYGKQVLSSTLTLLPDRKSTRLNSSHPSISYAVFCLKKKTK